MFLLAQLEKSYMDVNESKMIRIGVSSCLLGNKVRYDGGHKHDRYLTEIIMFGNTRNHIFSSSIISTLTQPS
jgi:hypothetical protein